MLVSLPAQSDNQSLNEWISQPVIKSFSRLVACLTSHLPTKSTSQWVSHAVSKSIGRLDRQGASQDVSAVRWSVTPK